MKKHTFLLMLTLPAALCGSLLRPLPSQAQDAAVAGPEPVVVEENKITPAPATEAEVQPAPTPAPAVAAEAAEPALAPASAPAIAVETAEPEPGAGPIPVPGQVPVPAPPMTGETVVPEAAVVPPPPVAAGHGEAPANTAGATVPGSSDTNATVAADAATNEVTGAEAETNSDFVVISSDDEKIEGAEAVRNPNQANLITITLDDVEMVDVVRMFTRLSQANIIVTPSNLAGRVTVNLTDVEWRPALESILGMHSLHLYERPAGSGVYTIEPRSADQPEPLIVETVFLKYATVDSIKPIVDSMIVPNGKASPFASRNAMVIRSTAANIAEIRQVVSAVDILRDQVFLEAKFLELNDEAIDTLGINWQSLQGYQVGMQSPSWSLNDRRDWNQTRKDTLSESDKRSQIDALDLRYGENMEPVAPGEKQSKPFDKQDNRAVIDSVEKQRTVGRDVSQSFTRNLTDVRTAVLGAQDFSVILSALKEMDGVRIVSNPKIIVANSQTAKIHVGEKEPNIQGSVVPGQQGQANTTTYSLDKEEPYFNFGISLEVVPTVNTESNITVEIQPKLTRFVKDKQAPDGSTYPITTTKEITTAFTLESGQTAAIGGLTESLENEDKSRIPFLGDIPLIGKYLFSHSRRQKSMKETIIFVTVELAKPQDIERDRGLPEDTNLARKHMLKAQMERQAMTSELRALENTVKDNDKSSRRQYRSERTRR